MTERFLISAWVKDDKGELAGPISFDYECGLDESAPIKAGLIKMSAVAEVAENSAQDNDLGNGIFSDGLAVRSIVRVTDGDEIVETTAQTLMDMEGSYDCVNESFTAFAGEVNARLSDLLEGIKNGDIKSGATVNRLQRLVKFTGQFVVEEDKKSEVITTVMEM